MSRMTADEVADFKRLIETYGLASSDFLVTPQPSASPTGVGNVTVHRKSTKKERQYEHQKGSAWHTAFELDLAAKAFN